MMAATISRDKISRINSPRLGGHVGQLLGRDPTFTGLDLGRWSPRSCGPGPRRPWFIAGMQHVGRALLAKHRGRFAGLAKRRPNRETERSPSPGAAARWSADEALQAYQALAADQPLSHQRRAVVCGAGGRPEIFGMRAGGGSGRTHACSADPCLVEQIRYSYP